LILPLDLHDHGVVHEPMKVGLLAAAPAVGGVGGGAVLYPVASSFFHTVSPVFLFTARR